MPLANTPPAQQLRPGERMVAGKPYVFNADLLSLHLARERLADAPASFSGMRREELTLLNFSAHTVDMAESGRDPFAREMVRRTYAAIVAFDAASAQSEAA